MHSAGSEPRCQHGLLLAVASSGVHLGSVVLTCCGVLGLTTDDTEQSYCGPAVLGSTSASWPSMHAFPMTCFNRVPICCRAPDRSRLQIGTNAFRFGNWSRNHRRRIGGSATSTLPTSSMYMHECARAGTATVWPTGTRSSVATGSLVPMMPATTTLSGSGLRLLR